uniref:MTS domain-containing protein n=1 Tax=Rhabditophanes sp. KR3021 TaxID=114890 RepID=A0AC35TVN1_9BILA
MTPTPLYSLKKNRGGSIYDPDNDTFLLMDSLEAHKQALVDLKPSIVLEVGSGTGIVTAFVRSLLKEEVNFTSFAIDLNYDACLCTQETSAMNHYETETEIICGDVSSIIAGFDNKIDVLIFNPPYVLTEEIPQSTEELCYAGGPNGRFVLDKLLPLISTILTLHGRFYLIAIKENDIDYLLNFTDNGSLRPSIVNNKVRGCENLFVLLYIKVK